MAANPVAETLNSWQPDAATNDTNLPTSGSPAGTGDAQDLAGNLRLLKSVIREQSLEHGWEDWRNIRNLANSANIAIGYSSPTVFTVNDNFTSTGRDIAQIGRRVRATMSVGPLVIYGTIESAVWSSPTTTITVRWDFSAMNATVIEVVFGVNARATAGYPMTLVNRTGTTVVLGDVVAIDSVTEKSAAMANVLATQRQIVIAMESIIDSASGAFEGRAVYVPKVNVIGVVTIGHYLIKSATSKVAQDSGVAQGDAVNPPAGAFAIALTTASGGSVAAKLLGFTHGSRSVLIPAKLYIPAAIVDSSSAFSCFDLPATNAPLPTAFGTNPNRFGALAFAAAQDLTAQFNFVLPSDWLAAGGLGIVFDVFSDSAAANNFVLSAATKSIADGEDVLNPSFNATQLVAKANNGTANTKNSAAIAALDTTGVAPGENMIIRVGRNGTNGGDGLAAAVYLRGVEITYYRSIS